MAVGVFLSFWNREITTLPILSPVITDFLSAMIGTVVGIYAVRAFCDKVFKIYAIRPVFAIFALFAAYNLFIEFLVLEAPVFPVRTSIQNILLIGAAYFAFWHPRMPIEAVAIIDDTRTHRTNSMTTPELAVNEVTVAGDRRQLRKYHSTTVEQSIKNAVVSLEQDHEWLAKHPHVDNLFDAIDDWSDEQHLAATKLVDDFLHDEEEETTPVEITTIFDEIRGWPKHQTETAFKILEALLDANVDEIRELAEELSPEQYRVMLNCVLVLAKLEEPAEHPLLEELLDQIVEWPVDQLINASEVVDDFVHDKEEETTPAEIISIFEEIRSWPDHQRQTAFDLLVALLDFDDGSKMVKMFEELTPDQYQVVTDCIQVLERCEKPLGHPLAEEFHNETKDWPEEQSEIAWDAVLAFIRNDEGEFVKLTRDLTATQIKFIKEHILRLIEYEKERM